MVELKKIVEFLNELLSTKTIPDSSNNGLQVEGKNKIKKVAFAVDASMEAFKKAEKERVDLIVVHHGLSWGDSLKYITGINYNRIKFLINNDIALYAAHLPLDKHAEFGNNAQLAKMFGLKKIQEFAEYKGVIIGFYGKIRPISINDFKKQVEQKLNTKTQAALFRPKKARTVGFISGGGTDALEECKQKQIDTLVTGEPRHSWYHYAQEYGINIIYAGHYATETLGVKALMELVNEKFGVETVFIDLPTGF